MEADLLERTKGFALPKTSARRTIGNQIARSCTSKAANDRAARRARSTSEFIAKLRIVHKEADETLSWLEMIRDALLIHPSRLTLLLNEANQLVAIMVSSLKPASSRDHPQKKSPPSPPHPSF